MTEERIPEEILACMLTGRGMGYFCEYVGPASAAELDASEVKPPREATPEQLEQWQASGEKSLAAYFRTFAPEGAPAPDSDPRDLISFMSSRLLDIAPFAKHFVPQRIPNYRPGPGEVLCKVQAICLCFSDCKIIHQGGSHVRLFNRDLSKEPNIPGHEACLEVVAVGERAAENHGIRPGERYAIQADIYVDGVSHAYGYYHRGAMQQFTSLPEEVMANDRGNCLIPISADRLGVSEPVKPTLGRAEAGLAEPWGCVAAKIEYRRALKPGGTTWFIGATSRHIPEVREAAQTAATLLFTGPQAEALAAEFNGQVVKDPSSLAAKAGEGSVDDIIVEVPDTALVEVAADAMAPHAVMVLPPFPPGAEAQLDVGAIHYKGLYFIAHTDPSLAATYARERRTRLKPGGRAMFIGAGGPMGQIWLQTTLDSPQPPCWMLVTEIDDRRLEHLDKLFRPQARARGVELLFANPLKHDIGRLVEPGSLDDVVGLCPVWAPIKQAEPLLAPGGVINIFAGIKAGTKGPVDLGVLTSRNTTIIGNSGSSVEDLTAVIVGAMQGRLRPNTSVATIGPITKVWEAMRRVMYRETSGKICIFPELDLPDLIDIDRLGDHFPTVAAKLDDHGFWTSEAEEELFRICPRLRP